MALVKNYGISTTDDVNYTTVFEIPNNCDYVITNTAGKYYINVHLKKGQTVPSTVFIPCTVSLASTADILDIEFQQVLNNITITKPKIIANNC